MYTRGVAAKWQSRRKISLGPVRRACPASGATWNVQVVKGKITTSCLWHALRALIVGVVLMTIGAGMATIGYYAEHISPHAETRNSSMVRLKAESKGIHLHNLSYAGPIVMGCGGFIIVAACVMTFEARDSAAKVVPARLKLSTNTRGNGARINSSRRTTASGVSATVGSQTSRWDNQLGVFHTSPCDSLAQSRAAQTAALVHFSKFLRSTHGHQLSQDYLITRSGSAPNLATYSHNSMKKQNSTSPTAQRVCAHHRPNRTGVRILRGMQRNVLNKSIDEAGAYFPNIKMSLDSQNSVGKESHELLSNDTIFNKRDRTKRSDTAKRHVLARQKPIDNAESHSANSKPHSTSNRSNSTNSELSNIFRRTGTKSSSISRTPSIDSRVVQMEDNFDKISNISASNVKSNAMPVQSTSLAFSGHFRSQLSVCSEPANVSVHPVPSDHAKIETHVITSEIITSENISNVEITDSLRRPTSLLLSSNRNDSKPSAISEKNEMEKQPPLPQQQQQSNSRKSLFSSSLHKKPNTRVPTATSLVSAKFQLSNELDKIFVISDNQSSNLDNSIQVIDERRMKNMKKSDRTQLYKGNTIITEEYYTNEPLNNFTEVDKT